MYKIVMVKKRILLKDSDTLVHRSDALSENLLISTKTIYNFHILNILSL